MVPGRDVLRDLLGNGGAFAYHGQVFHAQSLSPAPMSDKSMPQSGDFFAIPGYRVLAMEGRDAVKFAQAQFMNDVAALAPGRWQWNGWLTPKGRVIALFALLRFDGERLWLLLPDADPEQLAAQLARFVFRAKVGLQALDGVRASGAFAPPALASGASFAGDPERGVELDLGADGGPRLLRLAFGPAAAEDRAAAAGWTAFDLAHGLPRLDPQQSGQWTPQQLSLDRLGAYSVKKGCYPGQEIVARTHFLGQAKRGLALLETGRAVAPGTPVVSGDGEVGRVVCAAGRDALAVLPLDIGDHGFAVSGAPAPARPPADGLAR